MARKSEEVKLHSDGEVRTEQPSSAVRTRNCCIIVSFFIISLIIFIVGITLVVRYSNKSVEQCSVDANYCGFTRPDSEGSRLNEFLGKVQQQYYQLHPHKAYLSERDQDALNYRAFNPTHSSLKRITDTSLRLRAKLDKLNINVGELQPRERKAFEQLKHYLEHAFGQPYGVNYYNGDWQMGPNIFCWEPLCDIPKDTRGFLGRFQPRNVKHVSLLRVILKSQASAITQYIENIKTGVKSGMVRSVEDCKAGSGAMRDKFPKISAHGAKGILQSDFVQTALNAKFLSMMPKYEQREWKQQESRTVLQTIEKDLVDYIGEPIHQLINYLENERSRYCVPSSVSSGLATLPLTHIYVDQVKTNTTTTRRLPTGELLNGKKSYSSIMAYFTTSNITAEAVNKMGRDELKKLYKQALAIAYNMTGLKNESEAIKEFLNLQNSSIYKFHDEKFPDNESDAKAYNRCSSIESAQKYCPKRWQALQKYWKEARMVVSYLTPKTVPMFYFNGENITVPVCPVEMVPNFNPALGVESYKPSDKRCSHSSFFYTPFFVESFRKSFDIWTVTAHETIPGHHTQLQGTVEHFRPSCNDSAATLDQQIYYASFTEGWGLYSESPLIADTDAYKYSPMERYGMIRGQMFRALRLIVDTGLHNDGMSRDEALSLFQQYLWEYSDIISKEITRYQSAWGQATAYMIGKKHIQMLRKYAEDELGDKFNLKDFHYFILSQGSAPLNYLTSLIKTYVGCQLDSNLKFCNTIKTAGQKHGDDTSQLEHEFYDRKVHYY